MNAMESVSEEVYTPSKSLWKQRYNNNTIIDRGMFLGLTKITESGKYKETNVVYAPRGHFVSIDTYFSEFSPNFGEFGEFDEFSTYSANSANFANGK